MDLEAAARGYTARLDTFNPTKELKRKLEKTENRQHDEGKQAHLYFPLFRLMT